MTKEEMEKICNDFAYKHDQMLVLKANIAAINKMFIKRGKDQELYENILESMKEFEENKRKFSDL